MPKDFFTADSFYSLAGASGMVFVVCNALQGALNFNPRWLALAFAEIVAVYGTYASHAAIVPSDYFISILNGCLIYCTAVGGSVLSGSAQQKGRPKGWAGPQGNASRRNFLTSWY
jgi:hypothetical protein